jgi:diguanylate cyclase (GGDEF)-like protein
MLFLVDDDPVAIHVMGHVLSPLADIRFATSGADALRLMAEAPPDLVLLDAQLGDMDGLQVLGHMRADSALADVAVIFVTSHDEEALEVAVLEHGAVDFIAKPVRAAPLLARVRTHLEMRKLTAELRRIATQDGLTGVANRRAFDEALDRACRMAHRLGAPLSLLMVDVDCFKSYNDHHGHQAGDACLRQVAQVLPRLCQRPGDLAARYGGEEFALLLPDTRTAGALHLAHRLLDAVETLRIPHGFSLARAHVTVSVGVACLTSVALQGSAKQLVHMADHALYAAKHNGRAQACTAG